MIEEIAIGVRVIVMPANQRGDFLGSNGKPTDLMWMGLAKLLFPPRLAAEVFLGT